MRWGPRGGGGALVEPLPPCVPPRTFSALHGLDEDAPTVGKHPVAAAVAVLAVHGGAQRVRRLEQLLPDLVVLLWQRKMQH